MASSVIRKDEAVVTVSHTISSLAQGASGYYTIPCSFSGTMKRIQVATANIGASNGLQLTPVSANGTNVYINYYAPKAITNSVTLSINVYYIPS